MSKGPADPARGAQTEEAFVFSLSFVFFYLIRGQGGSQTPCQRVSRGLQLHMACRESEGGSRRKSCRSRAVMNSSSNVQLRLPNREIVVDESNISNAPVQAGQRRTIDEREMEHIV